MTIDLSGLSLKELKALQSRVAKEIDGFKDREKRAALAALDEKARELGYASAAAMLGATGGVKPRKRSPAVPKFANPANKSETWSGRGRKPLWFVAALKSGKTPDQMAI
ncbi:MAG: H-NS histone family protein [Cypionkella sp.]|nr:H-NS histone family protein [Cypionkella sp.]